MNTLPPSFSSDRSRRARLYAAIVALIRKGRILKTMNLDVEAANAREAWELATRQLSTEACVGLQLMAVVDAEARGHGAHVVGRAGEAVEVERALPSGYK